MNDEESLKHDRGVERELQVLRKSSEIQELQIFAKFSEGPSENDENYKNSRRYQESLTKALMMTEWPNKN